MEPRELDDGVVRLRPPGPDDVADITRICQDPSVQRWTTVPSPYTDADAEAFVTGWVAEGWAQDREATWGLHVDGALVGMVGLSLQPLGSAEVGYWLAPEARGRGLLHRALVLVLRWAFDAPDGPRLMRVEWRCYDGNWASWRAAWRVGFRFEGMIRGGAVQRERRRDTWVGTLLRDDPREPSAPWPATTVVGPVPPGS